ncbi:MAG: glycosyltransferase family 4 protein [Candidatus Cybelea sp.]
MTVAIISSRFPRFGAETFLGAELNGLRPHFDRVIVVPVRESLFSWRTIIDAFRTIRLHPTRIAGVVKLLFVGASRPSVFLKNLAVFPRALAVARTVELEKVDHIHAYWMSAPATVALVASQLTGIPWSASAHRWDIYERNLLERKAANAAFLRTISDRGSRDLAALIGVKHRRKVARVPVGVRVPAIEPRCFTGPLRLLCAANLIEQKGHFDLLEALAIAAQRKVEYRCDIAGSGPLYQQLERRICELGLSRRVFLRGRVDHARLLESLRRGEYDVAVLASRSAGGGRMEGIPVALIEAMAAGLPCIATNSGSIPELLDGTSGFVVPAGDTKSFADAIERLANADLRAELGRNARTHIVRHFNIEQTGPALAGLIIQS